MVKQFHTVTVATVRQETAAAVQIGFRIPESLKAVFRFDPGQYLTLKVEVDGMAVRRAYSICSPIQEAIVSVLVKRLPGGRVSNYLNDMIKVGDKLEVLPPGGHFKLSIEESQHASYFFIGAGSGITPLTAMIHSVLEAEPMSTCSLLYGNRDEDNIIFKPKLDRLSLVFQGRFSVSYVLSRPKRERGNGFNRLFTVPRQRWKGKTGRINVGHIQSFLANYEGIKPQGYYICGPGPMIETAVNALEEFGIDNSIIHREYFTSSDLGIKDGDISSVPKISNRKPRKVTVRLDGLIKEVIIEDDTNIVQALINEGVEPPYSCLSGTCSTCMAKVTKGEVEMDVSIGLEADEKEKGYILTCQSHPITDEVVLSYDID